MWKEGRREGSREGEEEEEKERERRKEREEERREITSYLGLVSGLPLHFLFSMLSRLLTSQTDLLESFSFLKCIFLKFL